MFKCIMVTLDGGAPSNAGLKAALELARDQHARLVGLHVIDDRGILANLDEGHLPAKYLDRLYGVMRKEGQSILAKAQAAARSAGMEMAPLVAEANGKTVAHAILQQARKSKADVIVMGTHGRRGLSRMLMGSDSEAVLRETRIPVLLVRGVGAGKRRRAAPRRPAVIVATPSVQRGAMRPLATPIA